MIMFECNSSLLKESIRKSYKEFFLQSEKPCQQHTCMESPANGCGLYIGKLLGLKMINKTISERADKRIFSFLR